METYLLYDKYHRMITILFLFFLSLSGDWALASCKDDTVRVFEADKATCDNSLQKEVQAKQKVCLSDPSCVLNTQSIPCAESPKRPPDKRWGAFAHVNCRSISSFGGGVTTSPSKALDCPSLTDIEPESGYMGKANAGCEDSECSTPCTNRMLVEMLNYSCKDDCLRNLYSAGGQASPMAAVTNPGNIKESYPLCKCKCLGYIECVKPRGETDGKRNAKK